MIEETPPVTDTDASAVSYPSGNLVANAEEARAVFERYLASGDQTIFCRYLNAEVRVSGRSNVIGIHWGEVDYSIMYLVALQIRGVLSREDAMPISRTMWRVEGLKLPRRGEEACDEVRLDEPTDQIGREVREELAAYQKPDTILFTEQGSGRHGLLHQDRLPCWGERITTADAGGRDRVSNRRRLLK